MADGGGQTGDRSPKAPHGLMLERILGARGLEGADARFDPRGATAEAFAAAHAQGPGADGIDRLFTLKARVALAMIDAHGDPALDGAAFLDLSRAWTSFADWSIDRALCLALAATPATAPLGEALCAGSGTAAEQLGLFVLGLGKLGGHDLNYSSDVDLICFVDDVAFARAVANAGGPTLNPGDALALANRVIRAHTQSLKRNDVDRIWRPDWRLRPDAPSSPLAQSLNSARDFFQSRSEPWNRLALIKSRVVAGDQALGDKFLASLENYLWRRSLDFRQLEEIAALKARINAEHPELSAQRHTPMAKALDELDGFNVKLGAGGIREIEFLVNAQQMIWGGRQPELRTTNTMAALNALTDLGHIKPDARDVLRAAYVAHRVFENRIQMVRDQHTHIVPADAQARDLLVAWSGATDWDTLAHAVNDRRKAVHELFAGIFFSLLENTTDGGVRARGGAAGAGAIGGRPAVDSAADAPAPAERTVAEPGTFGALGERARDIVAAWCAGFTAYQTTPEQRRNLGWLGADLAARAMATADADGAVLRLDSFFRSLGTAGQFLALLRQRTDLRDAVVSPLLSSEFMAKLLHQSPHVADVLAERALGGAVAVPTPSPQAPDFDPRARQYIFSSLSYEMRLEALRSWTNERAYLIAMEVFTGRELPEWGMRTYSRLAEEAVHHAVDLVAHEMDMQSAPISIAAYGRLGARALVPGSDLDLVFFAEDAPDTTRANRFSGRLRSALGAQMRGGRVYEIDTRLRPWGNSGPPVVPMRSFEKHQLDGARTWEHIALVPARFICGAQDACDRFRATYGEVMGRRRVPDQLSSDGARMLYRLRQHRVHQVEPGQLEIKERIGGLLETEYFIAWLSLERCVTRDPQRHESLVDLARDLEAARPALAGLADAVAFWQRWYFIMRLLGGEGGPVASLVEKPVAVVDGVTPARLAEHIAHHAETVSGHIASELMTPERQDELARVDLTDIAEQEKKVAWR